MRALLLAAVLLLPAVAEAGEPTVVIEEDGSITATITVGSAPDVALARVGDPVWVVRTSDDGQTEATVVGPDGDCQLVDFVSRTPCRPRSTASGSTRWRAASCRSWSAATPSPTTRPPGTCSPMPAEAG
ncbi:MAG: hypothetical protein GY898_17005 [Proteobacteria bacterium]|nr:hypothetical protein [Pseudomonadota bacterium]